MEKKELLSLIVNCYNEEETIPIFYDTVLLNLKEIKNIDYEIIFIDDASTDNTLNILRKLAKKNKKVKYISTTRRFGKEAGILAGYERAQGDYIVCIDVDLQDPPELLKQMYEKLRDTNYDCVATRSISRNGYSLIRKFFTWCYYLILKAITPLEMKSGIRDYRMITKRVKESILQMPEYNRYSRYLFEYLGYKTYWIEFDNKERVAGTTKWSFKKLFGVAMEAIITSSTMLLNIPIFIGIFNIFISIVITFVNIFVNYSIKLYIFNLFLFFSGLIAICIGLNSLYLSKMNLEIKKRPLYIINETEERIERE